MPGRKDKHYKWGSPEYHSWDNMMARITRPSSITICDRWLDFANFYADMGPKPSTKHSIDRIDNDGNYEPGNCRWATPTVQSINTGKRTDNTSGQRGVSWYPTRNKWVAYISLDGKRKTLGYTTKLEDAIKIRLDAEATYYLPILEAQNV